MSEINTRWKRDHTFAKRLTAFAIVATPPLWIVSYLAAWPATGVGPWQWFSAVSVATLLGAIAGTAGSLFGIAFLVTDAAPLEGSNR